MTDAHPSLSELTLDRGEEVLWTGKPILWIRMYGEEQNLVILGLGMVIFAYLFAKDPAFLNNPVARCQIVVGVLLGLYLLIGRTLVDVLVRSRTVYVVTSQRVVFLRSRPWRRLSIEHNSIEKLELALRDDGSGAITFCRSGEECLWWTLMSSSRFGEPRPTQPQYRLMVHDAQRVYEVLRHAPVERLSKLPTRAGHVLPATLAAAEDSPVASFTQSMRQGVSHETVAGPDPWDIVPKDAPSVAHIIGVYSIPLVFDVDLVELSVDLPASQVDVSSFTQEFPGEPRSNWQAPWQVRYLDQAGERVIGDEMHKPADEGSTRLAFYLHFLGPERPLLTPWGPVALPHSSAMPARLLEIIQYETPE